MGLYGELEQKRMTNARALGAFEARVVAAGNATIRTIRQGTRFTIYTVGYERRDGEELMGVLRNQGIRALADVRERPMSRKPDFRGTALRALCSDSKIEYQCWSMLGSTVELREELQASGDFHAFARQYRAHATRSMKIDLRRLAESIKRIPTALLCYERLHEDCHRSVIADIVAEQINASVIAIQ